MARAFSGEQNVTGASLGVGQIRTPTTSGTAGLSGISAAVGSIGSFVASLGPKIEDKQFGKDLAAQQKALQSIGNNGHFTIKAAEAERKLLSKYGASKLQTIRAALTFKGKAGVTINPDGTITLKDVLGRTRKTSPEELGGTTPAREAQKSLTGAMTKFNVNYPTFSKASEGVVKRINEVRAKSSGNAAYGNGQDEIKTIAHIVTSGNQLNSMINTHASMIQSLSHRPDWQATFSDDNFKKDISSDILRQIDIVMTKLNHPSFHAIVAKGVNGVNPVQMMNMAIAMQSDIIQNLTRTGAAQSLGIDVAKIQAAFQRTNVSLRQAYDHAFAGETVALGYAVKNAEAHQFFENMRIRNKLFEAIPALKVLGAISKGDPLRGLANYMAIAQIAAGTKVGPGKDAAANILQMGIAIFTPEVNKLFREIGSTSAQKFTTTIEAKAMLNKLNIAMKNPASVVGADLLERGLNNFLSQLNVLIANKRISKEAAEAYRANFRQWKLKQKARLQGIPPEKIEEAKQLYYEYLRLTKRPPGSKGSTGILDLFDRPKDSGRVRPGTTK